MSAPDQFTAAQIAAALGRTPQAVRQALKAVAATGRRAVAGNLADVWAVASLPPAMQQTLADRAEHRFFRSVEAFLQDPGKPWPDSGQIPPLREIADAEISKAAALKVALANAITRRNDTSMSAGERERIGLDEYRTAFGYSISARHWRNLLGRTLARDRGRAEFERLELYLADKPARKVAASPGESSDCENLGRSLALLADPLAPSPIEQQALWLAACQDFDGLTAKGCTERAAKKAVIALLWAQPFRMAKSRESLRKIFDSRFARWIESGRSIEAFKDGRVAANEQRRLAIPQEDLDLLAAHAVITCGGRISQAFRELLQAGRFSEPFQSRFGGEFARKSQVPAAVRNSIRHDVAMMKGVHSAPRNERDQGAYLSRCWDLVPAGAWWNADDATLPIYIALPDPENGWWTLMRGQFLLMIDLRSTCILGFVLMPSKGYNARAIRTLITRCADEHGLPARGFYFEGGIWKNSKILKGDQREAARPWGEVELGLRQFGLDFKHAIRARTKPVERVIGALQNYMEGEPGYAGREERHDPQEHFQEMKLAVEARRLDPIGRFYTLAQWEARLEEFCCRYNAEAREGRQTGGLSPAEAYEAFADRGNPPIKFDAGCRHLLAHHKRVCRVSLNGITLRFGRNTYVYRDAQTGALRGQNVIAWFDPDAPELITVTDIKGRNAFCVARSNDVPAVDAPDDILADEMKKLESHMGFARDRYRVLKSTYTPISRPNLVDAQTVEMGKMITANRDRLSAAATKANRRKSTVERAANEAGLPASVVDASRPGVAEGARDFASARDRIKSRSAEPNSQT